MVSQMPNKDEYSISKRQMLATIDVCMGGKIAEEIIFGEDMVSIPLPNLLFMCVFSPAEAWCRKWIFTAILTISFELISVSRRWHGSRPAFLKSSIWIQYLPTKLTVQSGGSRKLFDCVIDK